MNHKKWKKYLTKRPTQLKEHTDKLIGRETPPKFKIGTPVIYKDQKLPGQEGEYVVFQTKGATDNIIIVKKEEWKNGEPTADAETRTVSYLQVVPLSSVKREPVITGAKIKELNEKFEKIYLSLS